MRKFVRRHLQILRRVPSGFFSVGMAIASRDAKSREAAWEIAALRASLGSLADAERRGLLTAAGSGVRRALARRVRRLAGATGST